jgi:hypothetical protein
LAWALSGPDKLVDFPFHAIFLLDVDFQSLYVARIVDPDEDRPSFVLANAAMDLSNSLLMLPVFVSSSERPRSNYTRCPSPVRGRVEHIAIKRAGIKWCQQTGMRMPECGLGWTGNRLKGGVALRVGTFLG